MAPAQEAGDPGSRNPLPNGVFDLNLSLLLPSTAPNQATDYLSPDLLLKLASSQSREGFMWGQEKENKPEGVWLSKTDAALEGMGPWVLI